MRILSVRTKIEVVLVITFLLILGTVSVVSLTRTISNTHDDIDTFIRNSKGNYWQATGANIQIAIDDLGITTYSKWGTPRGTVWLPGNMTLNVSSRITVKLDTTLDMGGCVIKPTSNFDVILMDKGSRIRNGIIDVSDVGSYSKSVITFNANDWDWAQQCYVDNMELDSSSLRGTAIYLNTSSLTFAADLTFIFCNKININNFQYGIYINQASTRTPDNCYINGNVFTNVHMDNVKYCMKVYQVSAEASANQFENIYCNCTHNTEYIIWNNGQYSQFVNINAFNWDNNSKTRKSYDFSSNANGAYLTFHGGGNDLSFPTFLWYDNSYTIFNQDNSTLMCGRVRQYIP